LLLVYGVLASDASLILMKILSALLQFLVWSFYERVILRHCGKLETNATESSEPIDWNWLYWPVLLDPDFPSTWTSVGSDSLESLARLPRQLWKFD